MTSPAVESPATTSPVLTHLQKVSRKSRTLKFLCFRHVSPPLPPRLSASDLCPEAPAGPPGLDAGRAFISWGFEMLIEFDRSALRLLRFLWTTMDAALLRPGELAASLPLPLAAVPRSGRDRAREMCFEGWDKEAQESDYEAFELRFHKETSRSLAIP